MSELNYINTEDIFVFPSTRRMNKQVSARLLSEASLANIVNKLIDTDGFVITPVPEVVPGDATSERNAQRGFEEDKEFEFNVHGYYFNVVTAKKILDLFPGVNDDSIYANIYLDKTTDPNYTELAGQDSPLNNEEDAPEVYRGLTFSTTNLSELPEDSLNPPKADYSLLLFQKELLGVGDTDWAVPVLSRLKFYYTLALGVDGGEILRGDISV